MTRMLLIFTLLLSSSSWAYKLVIVQGISKSGQTFITRNGKKDGVQKGMEATFTSNDVSIIAKAISVTREFTQWEINNNYTEVPFRKGEIITYYDTKEYLWALTPEVIKAKYIKAELYSPRLSLGIHSSLMRGLSQSTSGSDSTSTQRGGINFEGMLEREITRNFAVAAGLRYAEEIINVDAASLVSTQFLGIAEGRYYFDKMFSFYNSRFMVGLGIGYGQVGVQASGQSSAGTALILPITKTGLVLPIDRTSDVMIEFAFDSIRSEIQFEDKTEQTSNDNNLRYGIAYKKYFK
jgi:hypothetical protein